MSETRRELDAVDRRVRSIIYTAVLRAYGRGPKRREPEDLPKKERDRG